MTIPDFSKTLISIVSDLSRDLPEEVRYQHLLTAMQQIFPCDAAVLLQLEGKVLKPLAVDGLSSDTMGRRFAVEEHPRLAKALLSREPIRFPADSELPDPYDGLVENKDQKLHIHDCMGVSLYLDEKPWGVLTLDTTQSGIFDAIDPVELRTFISLTEATVKAAQRIEVLQARVVREKEVAQSQREGENKNEIVGNSAAIKRLKSEINIVAQSPLTALILGETGVGKELVARQIHALSSRRDQALVYVNCAALPENIAESELFGHVKGAFTGAESNRAGKFELADGGTLFLDEIGELPLTIQAKLLRALQSGEIQRIGNDNHIEVDVRIIAATNRDLQQAVKKERFRSDLYHRLSVYPLHVPPLRERDKDILLLASYLLEVSQKRFGVQGLRLTLDAKQVLQNYPWPGNVRELEHLLSRAALKAINSQGYESRTITIDASNLGINEQDIDEDSNISAPIIQRALPKNITLKEASDQFQTQLIKDRLQEHGGNLAATARELGLNRGNFYRLLKRLNMR